MGKEGASLLTMILAIEAMSGRERLDEFLNTGDYSYINPRRYGKKTDIGNKGRQSKEYKELENQRGRTLVKIEKEIGRNDPCYCGSGKKYKKCCIGKLNEQIKLEVKNNG